MATRQYVGARYVPKFADPVEWDNIRSYEPLTIVQHLGNSFTSKIPVPAGVSIGDTKYWVNTGNYNAQIEQIEGKVDSFIENSASIRVSDFGAVGDGITDDTNAIAQAIDEANKTGKTVEFDTKIYGVRPSDIEVETSINFNGATIKVIGEGTSNNIFSVIPSEVIPNFSVNENFGDHDGTSVQSLYGKSFAVISPLSLGERSGYPGTQLFHTQLLCADGQGQYSNVKYYPNMVAGEYQIVNAQSLFQPWVSLTNVTIENATQKLARLFNITRNNVAVENVVINTSIVGGTGAIIAFLNCANNVLRNIVGKTQNTPSEWGYCVNLNTTSNTLIDNVVEYAPSSGGWAFFGNNYTTNVTLINSELKRWDSHYENHGYIHIDNCTFSSEVNLSSGMCEVLIANSTLKGITHRSDNAYPMWGKLTVKNCTFDRTSNTQGRVIIWHSQEYPNQAAMNYGTTEITLDGCVGNNFNYFFVGDQVSNATDNSVTINVRNCSLELVNAGGFINNTNILKTLRIVNSTINRPSSLYFTKLRELFVNGLVSNTFLSCIGTITMDSVKILNSKISATFPGISANVFEFIGNEISTNSAQNITNFTHAIVNNNIISVTPNTYQSTLNNVIK